MTQFRLRLGSNSSMSFGVIDEELWKLCMGPSAIALSTGDKRNAMVSINAFAQDWFALTVMFFYATAASAMRWHIAIHLCVCLCVRVFVCVCVCVCACVCVCYIDYIVNLKNLLVKNH
jgi:hypothetical protein